MKSFIVIIIIIPSTVQKSLWQTWKVIIALNYKWKQWDVYAGNHHMLYIDEQLCINGITTNNYVDM